MSGKIFALKGGSRLIIGMSQRGLPICIFLLLAGCLESGPSLQEIATATGYNASQLTSLSCSQARDKPGQVCSYEYQGRLQNIRVIKTDGGAWRYVEQLDR
jgi:hypothetical protein